MVNCGGNMMKNEPEAKSKNDIPRIEETRALGRNTTPRAVSVFMDVLSRPAR